MSSLHTTLGVKEMIIQIFVSTHELYFFYLHQQNIFKGLFHSWKMVFHKTVFAVERSNILKFFKLVLHDQRKQNKG